MREEWKLLMRMPWKHRLVMILLSIINIVMSLLAFDSIIIVIKSFLFSEILLIASYYDIRTRIIPDWIHLLILLVGLIEFDPVKSFVGLVVAPLPFLIMALAKEGSIGGGDVKLIGTMGFVFGLESCIIVAMFANVFAILFGLRYYLNIKKFYKKRIPFVPFLYAG
ncbi:MAG: prepilin peptidase [Firmicutes bacterium HGW-Firmicutes-5]|nr:MAG: prepilin peptidase [Firmicutes bacterium HGW-Firmicutes-5]